MTKPSALTLLLALAAGCGASNSDVLVSVRVAPASSATAAAGVSLDRVRLSLRRLRVQSVARGDDHALRSGPLLVDAAGADLSGAVKQLLSAAVPAGSYRKLKLDVHRVTPAEASAAPGLDALASRGASVLIDGSIDGQPFSFASSLEAELELETPFTVGGGATNLTLQIDSSKWFVAADGSRLDPRAEANRLAIEANIRGSLEAFEDDDHDGEDDHGGHHGGGDGGPGHR